MGSQELAQELQALKDSRKNGELSPAEFYKKLPELVAKLANELHEEVISEENLKKQIPLILAFLEEQIKKYAERGH
ncbi:hypothetical protein [Aquifex sp.]